MNKYIITTLSIIIISISTYSIVRISNLKLIISKYEKMIYLSNMEAKKQTIIFNEKIKNKEKQLNNNILYIEKTNKLYLTAKESEIILRNNIMQLSMVIKILYNIINDISEEKNEKIID